MFSGLFKKFEDCVESTPNSMSNTEDEIEKYRARKVALITGISGQVHTLRSLDLPKIEKRMALTWPSSFCPKAIKCMG